VLVTVTGQAGCRHPRACGVGMCQRPERGGASLTDLVWSPGGARHCRDDGVGWTLEHCDGPARSHRVLGTGRLRVHPVPDPAPVGQAEQGSGGAAGPERGRVDGGEDVGGHEVVRLRLTGATPVGLDIGNGEQHVGVDAGHRAGLKRERDQGERCVGQLRAEAGCVGAAEREQGGREDDEAGAARAGSRVGR
jgi:hypothetical protein